MGWSWSCVALTSPCSPGDAGSVPQLCPQLLSHGSPRSLLAKGRHTSVIQTITSALEPCPAAWGPPAAAQPGVLLWPPQPCPQAVGQNGHRLLLCSPQLPEVLPCSSTAGKPNTWDILVVCREIVS